MKRRILLIIIITLVLSTACMNKSSKKPMKVEGKEKAPEALTSIAKGARYPKAYLLVIYKAVSTSKRLE